MSNHLGPKTSNRCNGGDAATSPVIGKFMAFGLGCEEYAIAVEAVREIVAFTEATRVPRSEDYLLGVTNLRGRVIPVVDLGLRLGTKAVERTDHTVLIVVQADRDHEQVNVGLVVDEVNEVFTLREHELEPAPSLGTTESEAFGISGVIRMGERVSFLLDVDRLMSRDNVRLPEDG